MEGTQVIEFLNKEENKGFLQQNGFQTTVETTVEREVELTDERVQEFISKKPDLVKAYENQGISTFLKGKLGKDITEDILNGGLVEASILDKVKKNVVGEVLKTNAYADLLIPKLDLTKIEVSGEGITGLVEQLEVLKTSYPGLFGVETPTPGTPPLTKTKVNDGEIAKIESQIEELKKAGLTPVNRTKISTLLSQKKALEAK